MCVAGIQQFRVSETSMEAAFEAINNAPRIYIYIYSIYNYSTNSGSVSFVFSFIYF